ncbi:uncharacterized protein EURHEDRAFT_414911 [Aspergillus ruber CBS 135680]|uniref:magnesium chelatase n=1 Tax=Aspergillus ruber (strain CBS 135680) TaxID=1388766 RepID=A0A017S7M8_ASPRC|nr:uncharacterized protein EURHEDRAFT_414911 [Aspergillus ruber CBS 135680]EYE92962.1 hypothetical protein EURHEDRAFT_414911 [Aspergillus ruber CBS 135680]
MADWDLSDLAQELSDLEVALLLCLVARGHPLLETTNDGIDDVAKELSLICSNKFGLSCAVLDCSSVTSVEDFCNGIAASDSCKGQIQPPGSRAESSSNFSILQGSQEPRNRSRSLIRTELEVVNVVVAKNFNHVDEYIQLQALELIHSKKLMTAKADLNTPEHFLFVPLVARNTETLQPGLNTHFNDHLLISHFHDPKDGYTYLEDGNDWLSDGQSISSVVHKPASKQYAKVPQLLLYKFQREGDAVTMSAEVLRYQQDIIIFLRLSRAVAGGITTKSNNYFLRFSKFLAALHGLDYLTPSIAALAAKKVFRHRIIIAKPEDDRSLQYGSDLEAVSQVLRNVGPEEILESVLALEAPL